MKEAHSIGEFPIPEEVNLLSVPSTLVAECNSGNEINDVVMSELTSLCVESGIEVDSPDLVDFKRSLFLSQKFSEKLRKYGFNGSLSDFSLKRVNSEAVGNFPFLDEFDGRMFSAYVLAARYLSRIKRINDVVANMFVLSLTKDNSGHFKPRLRVSAYLQLPESMSMPLSDEEGRTGWIHNKQSFETRKKAL